jgi:hypothetical protein
MKRKTYAVNVNGNRYWDSVPKYVAVNTVKRNLKTADIIQVFWMSNSVFCYHRSFGILLNNLY